MCICCAFSCAFLFSCVFLLHVSMLAKLVFIAFVVRHFCHIFRGSVLRPPTHIPLRSGNVPQRAVGAVLRCSPWQLPDGRRVPPAGPLCFQLSSGGATLRPMPLLRVCPTPLGGWAAVWFRASGTPPPHRWRKTPPGSEDAVLFLKIIRRGPLALGHRVKDGPTLMGHL